MFTLVISALYLIAFAQCSELSLENFENDLPTHTWTEMNDPIMGGESTGNFSITGGALVFVGEVVDVPFLKAPGFIQVVSKMDTNFPNVKDCEGISFSAMSANTYTGLRFSFGTAHVPAGRHAYGYKAHFDAPVGSFQTVQIPFNNFTDYWSDATGDPVQPCDPSNPIYCPSSVALADLQTMAFWGEGVGGKVYLSVKNIKAYGCK